MTSTPKEDRRSGLLYGSFIGDALALGAHWVYDQEELRREYGRMADFRDPRPDSYHPRKGKGEQTHYGDQAMALLESLAAHGGFTLQLFAKDWERMWERYPDYLDHATKETLKHLAGGTGPKEAASKSNELGGAARIAPLLAQMAGRPVEEAVAAARTQTALTHGSPAVGDVAEFLTRLTFLLLAGRELRASVVEASEARYSELNPRAMWDLARRTNTLEVTEAAKELGLTCPTPKAFPTLLMLLDRCGDDFERALIANVMAGGDNAARGLALGMILGAAHGRSQIPERWLETLKAAPRLTAFLAQVAGFTLSEGAPAPKID